MLHFFLYELVRSSGATGHYETEGSGWNWLADDINGGRYAATLPPAADLGRKGALPSTGQLKILREIDIVIALLSRR